MISLSRIVALGCVGLVACGHGGGGSEVVRLAVGDRTDLGEGVPREHAVILRSVGGEEWTPVVDGLPDPGGVSVVFFASRDVAWAYGTRALRSTDGGRTWQDMVARLDAALPDGGDSFALRSMAFADADVGYFAAYSLLPSGFPFRGPFVWSTRDGGDTWTEVRDVGQSDREVGFMLQTRDGIPELLRHSIEAAPGVVVQRLDDVAAAPFALTNVPTVVGEGFDAVGSQGWIAVTVIPGDDIVDARPAIFTSDRPGAPWRPQPLPDERVTDFGTLDMCDAQVGIAGGSQLVPATRAIVYRTGDGGARWEPSALPDAAGLALTSLLCESPTDVWVVGQRETLTELYESRDGGRTFVRSDLPFDASIRVLGLASNAGLQ